ncbi:hypothetical protein [Rugamonas apoptosis]|uniref:Uncharacterized protein n=1 Tax=Rugamonas apoptosis TaxID=2758570 RepID=A0A7W2F8X6_9BURK|nr:hypothetical protein [Rugamonas apoptosis]MBA5687224.1 hypothetical protein [Rugamonas apoptosis]
MHNIKPIGQIRDALANLPENPREAKVASMFDAVRLLADDIRALLKKGYTYTEIANVLAEHGVQVSTRTLRTYMARIGGGGAKRKRAMPGTLGVPASPAKTKGAAAATPPPKPDERGLSRTSSARFSPAPDNEDL